MITLRPYQQDAVDAIRAAMRSHKSVLLQLPTGGGKTQIATDLVRRIVTRGKRVFFVCHRQELLDQTAKTFAKGGFDYVSFIAAGWPHDEKCPVQICSIGTLQNRINKIRAPDVVLWDEAHHMAAGGWAKTKTAFADAWHIGLSATPARLDGRGLREHFGYMVQGLTTAELIEIGALSKFRVFAPSRPDLSNTHSRMGDYVRAEIETAMDKPSITGDIISHWIKYAAGKRTLLFAASVEHSKHIAEQFRSAGVVALHLDGGSSSDDRRSAAKSFARGEIDVLCNVELFGEGYDLSAQAGTDVTVDAVIQARPTQSLSLHLQQIGRALRPKSDGSEAIILDHAGNVFRHGLADDLREWSLDGCDKKSGAKKPPELATKTCPKCFGTHMSAPTCKYCGHEYEIKARKIEHVDGTLDEITRDFLANKYVRETKKEQAKAATIDQLVELGKRRGMKNPAGWAAHVWTAREAKKANKGLTVTSPRIANYL